MLALETVGAVVSIVIVLPVVAEKFTISRIVPV
jgi:hypothetical protein